MKAPVNPGDQIDHYKVGDLVARGGVASIFRGTDMRTNRPVAIKIPDPEMESDPVFADRFRREEDIGKTLIHPGMLTVIADDHRSQLYLVTEWFEGRSLRQLLVKEKKLPPDRAVRIAYGVCDALAYIHGHGIVHRDLKPENILIDAEDHIKLIEFGSAAKAGARRITFANLTQVVGMSRYVSPEELNGRRGDARSDIYALGVVIYEMVTGKMPFPETNSFDRSLKDLVPPHELEPAISLQLQEVIYRALEPEHKRRYANAHEFALDLLHLAQVRVVDRSAQKSWKETLILKRKTLAYLSIGLIPVAIFALLLYFASR